MWAQQRLPTPWPRVGDPRGEPALAPPIPSLSILTDRTFPSFRESHLLNGSRAGVPCGAKSLSSGSRELGRGPGSSAHPQGHGKRGGSDLWAMFSFQIREDPSLCGDKPAISAVTVELSKETLDTMLDGLGRIRDQLSAVASK